MPQAVKDDIRRMQGANTGKKTIHVIVLGCKMPERDEHGMATGRVVPMDGAGIDTSLTWCTDAGYAPPTDADKAAILTFWKANKNAPDTYTYKEGERPPLKIVKKPDYRPSHTTLEEDI